MPAKYQIKRAKSGLFKFELLAANGETILHSMNMYTTKAACLNGVESAQKNCKVSERYEIRGALHDPHFVLKAANHQIIGTSEMYSSTSACKNAIASVARNGVTQVVDDTTAE